jgi:hypothetical protein
MSKVKEIYRSKLHMRDKSHDVCIIQDQSKVRGVKLKMTYECYNALERFTGEQWVGGKWEHSFSMLDLGIPVDNSMYIRDENVRLKQSEGLIKKGIEFFNILNS